MAKKKSQWAIVQHSGFGYADNPQFRRGLEMRSVNATQAKKVLRLGGVVFDDYCDADDYCMDEMYPTSEGMIPRAPGAFLKDKIDGLRVYVPSRTQLDRQEGT